MYQWNLLQHIDHRNRVLKEMLALRLYVAPPEATSVLAVRAPLAKNDVEVPGGDRPECVRLVVAEGDAE